MWLAFIFLGTMHTLEPCADKAIITVYATGFSGGKAKRALLLVLVFGVGMATAYMLIGAVFAFVGETLITQVLGPAQILASLTTITLGAYLLVVHKERKEGPGEHHHTALHGAVSIGSLVSVLSFGFICGAEPCPVELTAFMWAASSGSLSSGVIRMLAFSFGSIMGMLPLALIAGGLAGTLRRVIGERSTSKFAGIALIVMGIIMLVLAMLGIEL